MMWKKKWIGGGETETTCIAGECVCKKKMWVSARERKRFMWTGKKQRRLGTVYRYIRDRCSPLHPQRHPCKSLKTPLGLRMMVFDGSEGWLGPQNL